MEEDSYYDATIASVSIKSTYTITESLPTINESEDFISADANFLIGALHTQLTVCPRPRCARQALWHLARTSQSDIKMFHSNGGP
jgi:hypothetical protein